MVINEDDRMVFFAIEDVPTKRFALYAEMIKNLLNKKNPNFIIKVIGLVPEYDINTIKDSYKNNLAEKYADIKNFIEFIPLSYLGNKNNNHGYDSPLYKNIYDIISQHARLETINPAKYSIVLDLALFEQADEEKIKNMEKLLSHKIYESNKTRCILYSTLPNTFVDAWGRLLGLTNEEIYNLPFYNIPMILSNNIKITVISSFTRDVYDKAI
ncbi:MAG: hypothetical protein FWE90_12905 [Defluviitaleaceae bacterium]|nr:hypothetical protein [Defluviitaleaceae bacterium]